MSRAAWTAPNDLRMQVARQSERGLFIDCAINSMHRTALTLLVAMSVGLIAWGVMKSRSRTLADKSVDAVLAAIEVYNKPDFDYREESFAILAINSWELLLKARLLQLAGNRASAILVYERRRKANGQMSDKLYRKKGRAGTHLSVGMFKAMDRLRDEYGDTVPLAVRENLDLLCEIRDNAVHFLNKGFDLSKLVQELGTACVRNYLVRVRSWFGIDLSKYNFFLMPLAFVGAGHTVEAITVNSEERKVLAFLRNRIAQDAGGDGGDYSVALRLDLTFARSRSSGICQTLVAAPASEFGWSAC